MKCLLLHRVIVAILDAFHFDLSKSQFKHRDNPILSNSVGNIAFLTYFAILGILICY